MAHEAELRSIALDRLVKSSANVRKAPADKAAQAELKASIAAHGLQQSLRVRPARKKGAYEVIAGGRRLEALQALAEEGALPADHPVPCLISASKNAQEESLAENVVREPMCPADEFEAFAGLVKDGQTAADIARRFGVSERHVNQRLKLGRAAAQLRKAYRDGDMSLDLLMAFTLTDDHKAQRAVWKQLQASFHASPHMVRRLLTDSAVPLNSALGRFVGTEAYEAAGGTIVRDLFSEGDDGYMQDAALAREIAERKLSDKAKELAARWKWVEAALEADYARLGHYGRVYPEPVDVPAEIVAEIERLNRREDELANLDEDDWTADLEAEANRIETRQKELREIVNGCKRFSEEQRQSAGCLVTIDRCGELLVHEGLVRPEDRPRPEHGGASAGSGAAVPEKPLTPEQVFRKESGYSQTLIDDLKAERCQITKAHLAADFETAFDAALYCLATSILSLGASRAPFDLRANRTPDHPGAVKNMGATRAAEVLEAQRAALNRGWLGLPPAEAFAAMSALPNDEKSKLFAYCVAQMLEPQLPQQDRASPVAEAVGERLGIDFRAFWAPEADTYWFRVKKDFALDQAEAVLGRKWRDEHARLKKKNLAPILGAIFSGEEAALGQFDEATRQAVLAWTPPGMTYSLASNEPDRQVVGLEGEAEPAQSAPLETACDVPDPEQSERGSPHTDEADVLPAFLTAGEPDDTHPQAAE